MIAWVATALACDAEGLEAYAKTLSEPPTTAEAGLAIAALCPNPMGLNRALRKPEDPQADVQAAVSQAGHWVNVCKGGLDVLPEGFEPATAGERQAIWTRCDLARYESFEFEEWLATTGPAISVVLLADAFTRARLAPEARAALLRAWAGIPPRLEKPPEEVEQLGELDPLAGFRDTAPARAVTLAKVAWPPRVDLEATCLVEVHIVGDGTPAQIDWLACPEELQSYVLSAIEASWFQPARRRGHAVKGQIRLRYVPSSRDPVPAGDFGAVSAPSAEPSEDK